MDAELARIQRVFTSRVPAAVRHAAIRAMTQGATEMVQMMKQLAPVGDSGALSASIGWTWGDAPAGSLVIDQVGNNRTATLKITIYAGNSEAFYAAFVEFGTRPHSIAGNASVDRGLRQGGGTLHPGAAAHPFFWPAYRALKKRVKSRITREINKAIKRETR